MFFDSLEAHVYAVAVACSRNNSIHRKEHILTHNKVFKPLGLVLASWKRSPYLFVCEPGYRVSWPIRLRLYTIESMPQRVDISILRRLAFILTSQGQNFHGIFVDLQK